MFQPGRNSPEPGYALPLASKRERCNPLRDPSGGTIPVHPVNGERLRPSFLLVRHARMLSRTSAVEQHASRRHPFRTAGAGDILTRGLTTVLA